MADTHINAYFADVDAAQTAVTQAQGELQAATDRLAAKKKADHWVDPEVQKEDTVRASTSTATGFKKK